MLEDQIVLHKLRLAVVRCTIYLCLNVGIFVGQNVLFPLVAGADGCQAYQSNLQCYILWPCYLSSLPVLIKVSLEMLSGTKTTDWHQINICVFIYQQIHRQSAQ